MPLLFFFPFLTPALRVLAALAPDRSLRRLRAARGVILQTAFALMRDHRAVLAKEARARARACSQGVLLAVRIGALLLQWVLLYAEGPRCGPCWLHVEGPCSTASRMRFASAARMRPQSAAATNRSALFVRWHRLLHCLWPQLVHNT
jgi:hypothetical protein